VITDSGQADHSSERSDEEDGGLDLLSGRVRRRRDCTRFVLHPENRHDDGLWSVVGGAVGAPSKDLWETRSVRFPQGRHDP
jgi:hypothetical protein